MIIGTDLSLQECKDEGYTMMKYDDRKPFDPDEAYEFFQYVPKYMSKEDGFGNERVLRFKVTLSFNDIKELYLENKKGIDSFADTNLHVNFESPDFHDALTLADEVDAYGGYLTEMGT